jgi:uncharacterized NAD(P)/FAD-binding protein YdhS
VGVAAHELRTPTTVVVIESRERVGEGLAYSTPDPAHLLNVPVARMPTCPGARYPFLDWVQRYRSSEVTPHDFVARAWFGDYLSASWRDLVDTNPWVDALHVMDRATGLRCSSTGIEVLLARGQRVTADAVVLAVGNLAARTAVCRSGAGGCERSVADPWASDLAERIGDASSVLLVGTGLTMVDVAPQLNRPGRILTAVSGTGRLPRIHRGVASPPALPPEGLTQSGDPDAAARVLVDHLRRCAVEYRDWRPAIDGLRSTTPAVWQRMSDDQRARAIRGYGSWWSRHRHRMPPQSWARLRPLLDKGELRLRCGRVDDVRPAGGGLRVSFEGGSVETFDAVVNCSGRETDFRCSEDPLVGSLLRSGIVRPGSLGMGLDTDRVGQLLDRAGDPVHGLYTLGAPRVGQLWETTAAAEICQQALDLGRRTISGWPPTGRPIDVRHPAHVFEPSLGPA